MVIPLLNLGPYLSSGTELARLRNALIFDAEKPFEVDWTPQTRPADFLIDEKAPDPYFVDVVNRLNLAALPSDMDRARAIAAHLLGSHPPLLGGAVQSNLIDTYEAIIGQGTGYCADFVLVFRALAGAAGLPVRAWAFSFDGFGGYGHVWPEIWDRDQHRWYLLDIYNNNYFVRAGTDTPLSALEFRQVLSNEPGELRLLRLDPKQPPGYVHEDKVLAYYRRGLPEWYVVWGNNPFTYEDGTPYRWLLPISRPIAQLTAMANGVQPGLRPLSTPENRGQIQAMQVLGLHMRLAALSFAVGVACFLWAIFRAVRASSVGVPTSSLNGC